MQIDVSETKQIKTHVEVLQDPYVWAADFMPDIWDENWRGKALDLFYIREGSVFSFLVEIEGRDKVEGIQLTRMLRVSEVEEVQRRASYRLQHAFDVYLKTKTLGEGAEEEAPDEGGSADVFDDEQERLAEKCKGVDISETGVGLTAQGEWQEGDEVTCEFEINGEVYALEATIVRRLLWEKEKTFFYRLGIKFNEEDEAQSRSIRRFIYQQQIRNAKDW